MLKCLNAKMNKAMTLIEVLVVIAIILILLSVVFINPRPQAELDRAARQLANDLRRAQNMAMASEIRTIPCDYMPCGYGINFNDSDGFYTLFGDFGAIDCAVIPPEVTCPGNEQMDGGESIKTIEFHLGTITITGGSGNAIFYTPSGEVSSSADIDIQDSTGATKRISVSSAGKIEIE
ncbi:GspH/FimT family protein [Candidatus Parcubacteria bacterium]|nr:GspH/FimT family protein [Candidatus Parcubacteria bacterium]